MKRYTDALNEIIKLHGPTEGVDEADNVIAICELCGQEDAALTGEPLCERFPCRTYTIAHKVLNPQIPIADVRKDALHRVRSSSSFDPDKPKARPKLKAVE